MDPTKQASGDGKETSTFLETDGEDIETTDDKQNKTDSEDFCNPIVTPQIVDNNEVKLRERIAQCKNIIESLKLQLNEEKKKCSVEKNKFSNNSQRSASGCCYVNNSELAVKEATTSMLSASVDNKLHCDENLIEYEKQLQKYQTTLNIAQTEKKNAIRKQMLAKAFKLKLMEVENQCNIELLRVKQSLQCLEPLQMIAEKWKYNNDDNDMFDFNNFELMSNFLEFKDSSGSNITNYKDEFENMKITAENMAKDV